MKTTKMNKTVDAFEIEIKRLLKKGLSVKDAVNEAYKKYPVMSAIKKEIEPQIISEMKRGSGGNISLKTIKLASQLVWSEDELTLSERTIKGKKEVIKQVSNTIKNAIKKGESVQKTALALFDGYGYGNILPTQEIPEFLKNLVNTAKKTDLTHKEINALIRQVERQLKKVNVTGMKIAYNKVKEAVKTGRDRVVEKAIYIATQERTRYFARRIARTELARAYADGVMGQWANDEDCIAFKWQTSSNHGYKDICDLYANADLYGMGKGVYPKDKVPTLPVHPNCMCHIRPLMQGSKYIQGEEKEQIQKGGMEYIKTLSKLEQERLLGVYGRLEVLKKENWTGKARNYSKEYMKSRIENGRIEERKLPIADWENMKTFNSYELKQSLLYFKEETVKWKKQLFEDEEKAVNAYTGDDYLFINGYLRKNRDLDAQTVKTVKRQIKLIDEALSKFEVKDYVRLYRGCPRKDKITKDMIGHIIQDPAYQSATTLYDQAAEFAEPKEYGEKEHIFEICMPPGKGRGAYVCSISEIQNESEFLIARGTKFKIVDVNESYGIVNVKLEVSEDG